MKRTINFFLIFIIFFSFVYGQEYSVGDHELLLMPTAETMPKSSSYLSNYELICFNFCYALTSQTNIGIFAPLPISTDSYSIITLGVKHQYIHSGSLKAAGWVTYSPVVNSYSLGSTFSLGSNTFNVNAGFGILGQFGSDSFLEFLYMAGIKYRLSKIFSIITEYSNIKTFSDWGFGGFLSVGLRIHLKQICIDIGGLRLLDPSVDLITIPIVKATILF